MTAMGSRQHMVMIDPVSFIDVVPASEEKIHTMLFGLDHQKMVISSQPLPAKVWQRIKDPHVDMLTLDNTVYRIQRIPELGSGIVTWSSTLPLQQRIRQQLFFWLPAGIFTSLLATWLLLRLLRHLRSPRNSMLDALNSEAIQVHYQPIISLQDGKIAGAEALARWQQPDGTFYRRIFYSSGRADRAHHAADGRYRQENFADLGPWLRQRPEVHISINLSVDDLRSPTLPMLLHDQLQHWGIAAEQIILEITERGFVDPETTMPVIAHYRQAGHRISIDDFGTGYSSLSYLQKLDVDTLKIDKSLSIPSSTGR